MVRDDVQELCRPRMQKLIIHPSSIIDIVRDDMALQL
jgi:hypothetical protein